MVTIEPHEIDFRWVGRLEYLSALRLQEDLVQQRKLGRMPDTVLFLEHEPVYTIGRSSDRTSLLDGDALPHPVVEINRGGKATFHGPGQLVGYLILDLHLYRQDLHAYLRSLESAILDVCASLGVNATRREGLTGVWVEGRKIASIGVGVRHWVTMHGFALNVSSDLSGFDSIVPCGIQDVEMTSINRETGGNYTPEEISEKLQGPILHRLAELRQPVAA